MPVLRTIDQIRRQPCTYKIKDIPSVKTPIQTEPTTTQGIVRVKKIVHKTDSSGNLMYKTIQVEKKKGCGCNGKAQEIVIEEKQIPDTEEIWVEMPVQNVQTIQPQSENKVLCKLFGTVPENYCTQCKTYKP